LKAPSVWSNLTKRFKESFEKYVHPAESDMNSTGLLNSFPVKLLSTLSPKRQEAVSIADNAKQNLMNKNEYNIFFIDMNSRDVKSL
jgi:hypothetical protein